MARPPGEDVNPGSTYTPAEVEFMLAMDEYKRLRRRPFPTWSEVLEVAHSLGYRKATVPTTPPTYKRYRT